MHFMTCDTKLTQMPETDLVLSAFILCLLPMTPKGS